MSAARSLAGMRIVVSAGPTFEDIDPVRFIGNRSSGKMGFAIAEAAARRGAEVVLVAGPVTLPTPAGVARVNVRSAAQMHATVLGVLHGAMVEPDLMDLKRDGMLALDMTLAAYVKEGVFVPGSVPEPLPVMSAPPSKVMAFPAETAPLVVRAPALLPVELALIWLSFSVSEPVRSVWSVPLRRSALMVLRMQESLILPFCVVCLI